MNPTDRKILKQALASLPSSRRASLESLLVEDAIPESQDQNLPEAYYGLEPKGVQAGTRKAGWDEKRALKPAFAFGQSLAGRPDIAIKVKDALKAKSENAIGMAFLEGYNAGQYALDEAYQDAYPGEWSTPLKYAKSER